MTRKFRKTALIEAVETYEDAEGDIAFRDNPRWLAEAFVKGNLFTSGRDCTMKVKTLEGVVDLKPGSWLARGINGEIWPIDPDVFEKTYEEAYDY